MFPSRFDGNIYFLFNLDNQNPNDEQKKFDNVSQFKFVTMFLKIR